jgi:peptide/nickel transport system substrate-binding protein
MLQQVGIGVALTGYSSSLYYGPVGVGILANGKYEAALFTWYAGIDPDDSSELLCGLRPPHGYDWSRYCSPAMDAAQALALSHYDRATRKRAYATIEELLARDAPFAFLWWPRQIEAVDSGLQHFRPNGIIEDWNAWQWSF